jgi:glutamine---fructose-6-phosphate transaminase (isomerizing)
LEILGVPWQNDAEQVVQAFSTSLDRAFEMRGKLEEFCRGVANTEIIGRGPAYGAAVMSALCIREMTGHRAAPHTGAGFRHGPILDVDATHLAIIFALGRTVELGVKLARDCNRRGGKVVLVSAEDREPSETLFPVRLDAVPDLWEGITSLVVPQALTLAMVERTGSRLPPRFQYGVMEQ